MSLAEPRVQSVLDSKPLVRSCSKRVLILGNDDRVVLAVARGLGREGIQVHVAWCDPQSPALRSRYVTQFHWLPPFQVGSDEWLVALNRLALHHAFDLVIPCNDFAVLPLQTERQRLDPRVRWYLIDERVFRVVFDKGETSRLARALGIRVPREFAVDQTTAEAYAAATEITEINGIPLSFPVFVKPRSSITPADVAHKRAVQRVEAPGPLAATLGGNIPTGGWLVQECFQGVGIGVEVLASDGEILMLLQHQRLRETIDGGSTYRETIAAIPELSQAASRLIRELRYTGVAMFEFRYQPQTGDWVFLEINPRFWGSLPLAIAAGANFPFALYQLLVHGRQRFDSGYRVGRRCRNLLADLRARRKQRGSRLDWIHLFTGKDSLDFFARDDWRPQISRLWQFFRSAIGRLGCRLRNGAGK